MKFLKNTATFTHELLINIQKLSKQVEVLSLLLYASLNLFEVHHSHFTTALVIERFVHDVYKMCTTFELNMRAMNF